MGITVLSSVSANSASSPLAALTGGLGSEALPADFAALFGEQLAALLAEPPATEAAALSQEPTLTEGLANLVALVSNKQDAMVTEDLQEKTEQALSPEQLAALAALNPALSSQILPSLPQNSLPTNVDRDILAQAQKGGSMPDIALAAPDEKGDQARPGQISLLTTTPTDNLLPTKEAAQSFATALNSAQNQPTGTQNTALPLATMAAEPHLANRSEAANIAAELPAAANTPSPFTNALSSASTTKPILAPEQAAALNVPTPIHETRWAQDFGEKIVWMTKSEHQTAQISINPPQLGPMQISINLNGDQASAIFASPHAEVRQAIEDAMPRLREMLSAAGISLGDANVGTQLPQQNRDNAQQFSQSNPNGARFSDENAILGGDSKVSSHSATLPIQRGRGLVDLFA